MTEQELKDEREQAVKRGGEIYADHYMEGLLDGKNLALSQFDVSGQFPPNAITDKEHKDLMKVLYPKDNSKRFRR